MGDSKQIPLKQFYSLEEGSGSNPNFKEQYAALMKSFQELGHMEAVPPDEIQKETEVYFYHKWAVFE